MDGHLPQNVLLIPYPPLSSQPQDFRIRSLKQTVCHSPNRPCVSMQISGILNGYQPQDLGGEKKGLYSYRRFMAKGKP